MTALVDRLEQLHARYLSEQPGYRVETRTKLEREMLGALPALLTALRAAQVVEYNGIGASIEEWDALDAALAPLFGAADLDAARAEEREMVRELWRLP